MIITLPNDSTHLSYLFHIPLTCTYPFIISHFCILSLKTKNSIISSFHVNPIEILIHVHRASKKIRGKRKEKKKEKKRERNKRKKKKNKLRGMHSILPSHLYHFYLSQSSIIIHIILSIIIISGIHPFFSIHFVYMHFCF